MPTRFRVGILYALLVACCLLLVAAPLVFRAPSGVRAGLRDAPVGGGPPASRPRRELRSARRLEARPGPAAALHTCGAFVADVARCVCSLSG